MKLLGYELKKLTMHRFLLVFLAVCLCGNFILCYTFAKRDDTYFYLQEIEEAYRADPDSVVQYYNDLRSSNEEYLALMEAFHRGEIDTEPILFLPCTYSGNPNADDYLLLGRFFSQQSVSDAFSETMNQVIVQAKVQQSEILYSYHSESDGRFGYQQQGLIAHTYENVLKSSKPLSGMGYGWDQFFEFDTLNIFLLLLSLTGTLTVFLSDSGKIGLIVRTTKKGERQLSLAKIATFVIFSTVSALLLLLTAWCAVLLKCGAFSDASNSIAVFSAYRMMPLGVSVFEYFWLYLSSKLLLGWIIAAICALFCLLFRNISLGCVGTIVVAVLSFLLYEFLPTAARYVNLYGLARFVSLTLTFRCLNFFGYAVLLWPFVLIAAVALALLLSLLVFFFCRRSGELITSSFRPGVCIKKLVSKIPRFQRKKESRSYGLSLLNYEFRKLFLSRTIIFLLVIAALLKIGISTRSLASKSSYQTMLYTDYMETLEGPLSQEKQMFIEEEYQKIRGVLTRYGSMQTAFFGGSLNDADYAAYLEEYRYAVERADLIEKIREHSRYLETLPEKGVADGYFLYDVDWDRLWESSSDLLLVFCIVYLSVGVFTKEYSQNGIIQIIRTTKKGRTTIFNQKILVCLISTTLLTFTFGLFDLFLILSNFRLPCLDAPLLSFAFFKDSSTTLTILQFLILSAFLRMVFALLIALLSTMVGALLKNKFYTLTSVFAVIFLPGVATKLGLTAMQYFDLTNSFSPAKLFQLSAKVQLGGDWGYLLVLLSVVSLTVFALTLIAKKEYCK